VHSGRPLIDAFGLRSASGCGRQGWGESAGTLGSHPTVFVADSVCAVDFGKGSCGRLKPERRQLLGALTVSRATSIDGQQGRPHCRRPYVYGAAAHAARCRMARSMTTLAVQPRMEGL